MVYSESGLEYFLEQGGRYLDMNEAVNHSRANPDFYYLLLESQEPWSEKDDNHFCVARCYFYAKTTDDKSFNLKVPLLDELTTAEIDSGRFKIMAVPAKIWMATLGAELAEITDESSRN